MNNDTNHRGVMNGCAIERSAGGYRAVNWTLVAAVVYLAGLLAWEWLG